MSFVAVVEARTGVACCWRAPLLRGSGPIPRRLRDGLDLAEVVMSLAGFFVLTTDPGGIAGRRRSIGVEPVDGIDDGGWFGGLTPVVLRHP